LSSGFLKLKYEQIKRATYLASLCLALAKVLVMVFDYLRIEHRAGVESNAGIECSAAADSCKSWTRPSDDLAVVVVVGIVAVRLEEIW
jgi:hypothetical protein